MIKVTPYISLRPSEIKLSFMTSSGPGGQNVNKTATTVQLRFDILHSTSLSEEVRARLLLLTGKKTTKQGELIIKAGRYRTQERNKQDAFNRLVQFIKRASVPSKKRKKTKLPFAAKQLRLETKKLQAIKKNRRRNETGKE